jgi:hypothetical protein
LRHLLLLLLLLLPTASPILSHVVFSGSTSASHIVTLAPTSHLLRLGQSHFPHTSFVWGKMRQIKKSSLLNLGMMRESNPESAVKIKLDIN